MGYIVVAFVAVVVTVVILAGMLLSTDVVLTFSKLYFAHFTFLISPYCIEKSFHLLYPSS